MVQIIKLINLTLVLGKRETYFDIHKRWTREEFTSAETSRNHDQKQRTAEYRQRKCGIEIQHVNMGPEHALYMICTNVLFIKIEMRESTVGTEVRMQKHDLRFIVGLGFGMINASHDMS